MEGPTAHNAPREPRFFLAMESDGDVSTSAFALGGGVLDAPLEGGAPLVGLLGPDLQALADLAGSASLARGAQSRGSDGCGNSDDRHN
jgi:hypothetical protein